MRMKKNKNKRQLLQCAVYTTFGDLKISKKMSTGAEKLKRKRKSSGANKRWTEAEEILILNYLLDLAPKNLEFEVRK